jgi:hypothetical protein
MRKTQVNFALLAVSIVASLIVGASNTQPVLADDNHKIAIRDDCKPNADWGPGGCLLREGMSRGRSSFRRRNLHLRRRP